MCTSWFQIDPGMVVCIFIHGVMEAEQLHSVQLMPVSNSV